MEQSHIMHSSRNKLFALLAIGLFSVQASADPMASCRTAYLRETKIMGPGGVIVDPGGVYEKAAARECAYEQAKDSKAFGAKYGQPDNSTSTKPKVTENPKPPDKPAAQETPRTTTGQDGEGAGKGGKKSGGGTGTGSGGGREGGGGKGTVANVRTQ